MPRVYTAREKRTCLQCGITFMKPPCRRGEGRGKFCSRACKSAYANDPEYHKLRLLMFIRVEDTTGCWLWMRRVTKDGYGLTVFKGCTVFAHRHSYRLFKGPIPAGLMLDHLCRTPRCINPDHLEPVTPRENMRRGEIPWANIARTGRCKRGHPFSGNNVYLWRGVRACRTCRILVTLRARHAAT
jgi:hypothetical protein